MLKSVKKLLTITIKSLLFVTFSALWVKLWKDLDLKYRPKFNHGFIVMGIYPVQF